MDYKSAICFDCVNDKNNCPLDFHESEHCNCEVANTVQPGSYWGDGNFRCEGCGDKRRIELHKERSELNAAATCEECGEKTGDYGLDLCEECCEHSDTDDYCCLICGKDMTESYMAAAYDRAKDAAKYGDE